MTARLTRTIGSIGAASLLTFAIAQGCASEGDTNIGDTDNTGSPTSAAGGSTGEGGTFTTSDGGSTTNGQGGMGNTPFECGEEISNANIENLPADLVGIVDNSNSMIFEAGQVRNQMNGLVSVITATGIDAHVVLISKTSDNVIFDFTDTGVCLLGPLGTGSCPADEKLPNYRHVPQEVGSTDALSLALSTYDEWKDALRPNATKTFLVVSDDDSGITAAAFTSGLAALSPPITDFKFNAITASNDPFSCAACFVGDCGACTNPCCDKTFACAPLSTARGAVYEQLQAQTSGVYGDLCSQNFAPTFTAMANAVIEHTTINCTFDIPTPPSGTIVPTETNVDFITAPGASPQAIFNVSNSSDCGINGGWYFDNNTNPTEITLCPTTCNNVEDSTEGSVRVKYGCQTETVPQ